MPPAIRPGHFNFAGARTFQLSFDIGSHLGCFRRLIIERLVGRFQVARERPTLLLDDGYYIVRMPQRPRQEMEVLAKVNGPDGVSAWMREHGYER